MSQIPGSTPPPTTLQGYLDPTTSTLTVQWNGVGVHLIESHFLNLDLAADPTASVGWTFSPLRPGEPQYIQSGVAALGLSLLSAHLRYHGSDIAQFAVTSGFGVDTTGTPQPTGGAQGSVPLSDSVNLQIQWGVTYGPGDSGHYHITPGPVTLGLQWSY